MKKINLIFFLILFLASSNSYAEKWHINMKKKEKKDFANYVLKAQSDNKMVFNTRNIKNPNIYKFFDNLEDRLGVAEKGIEFDLKYSYEGHKLDWKRFGIEGHAQRFQIMEPYKETTKKNKTKWYRVGYFVPVDIRTDKHTISLFDFKKLYGKGEKTHDGAFNIVNNRFTWNFNSTNYTEKGFMHLWIDGTLRSSYFGDTLAGASSVRFKFGPYRHHMHQATNEGLEVPDLKIRYSNVGKADKCEDLWSGCNEIISQLSNQSQLNGVRVVVLCKTAPQSGTCKNLGYPNNKRPF